MIIFNEKKYVENEILKSKRNLSISPSQILMLIRYYNDQGQKREDIQKLILNHLIKNSKTYCLLQDTVYFNLAFDKALQRKSFNNDSIVITKVEFDFIKSVNNIEKEKLLFTLLVIQKFFKLSSNFDNCKVSIKDLKKLSLSKKSYDSIYTMLYELEKNGYIKLSWKNRYKVNQPLINSENYIVVNDFDRIPIPYLKKIKTNEYFYCEWCGKKIYYKNIKNGKSSKNSIKYCPVCAKIPHKERYKIRQN